MWTVRWILSSPGPKVPQCQPPSFPLTLSSLAAASLGPQDVTYAQLCTLTLRQGTTAPLSSLSKEPSWQQQAHCSGVHQRREILTPPSMQGPQGTSDLPWKTLTNEPATMGTHVPQGTSGNLWDSPDSDSIVRDNRYPHILEIKPEPFQ
jgi:hypothetical protein